MISKNLNSQDQKAEDIMSKTPKTVDENKFAVEALNVMKENHITQLIVTNEKKEYKGIVHLHDLIREGII